MLYRNGYNVAVRNFGNELEIRIFDCPRVMPKKVVPLDDFDFDFNLLDQDPLLFYLLVDDFVYKDPSYLSEEELLQKQLDSERSSRARTMRQVYYLSRSYEWDWFVTFTFSPQVVDRYDYAAVSGLMSSWLKALRRRCPDVRYMIVPEMHKDGAYHFHGLFASCTAHLELFEYKDAIYNVNSFKHGYTTATAVRDSISCSRYVSKYITKDLISVTKGKKRYWHSRNVSVPDQQRLFLPIREMQSMLLSLQEAALYKSQSETPLGDKVSYFTVKADALPPALLSELLSGV